MVLAIVMMEFLDSGSGDLDDSRGSVLEVSTRRVWAGFNRHFEYSITEISLCSFEIS